MPKYEWDEFIEVSKKRFPKIMADKKFYKWLQTKRSNGRLFDLRLYRVCYTIHRRITNTKRPLDNWIAISGEVGSGKSTLGIKVSSTVSPNFEIDDIIFDYNGLRNGIKKSIDVEGGYSLSLDEAVSILFSREAMKKGNVVVVKTSMMMRLFRINVVLCIPKFFSIDPSIREDRISCLLYIYKVGKYVGITKRGIDWLVNHKDKYRTLRKAILFIPNELVWHGDFNRTYPISIPEKEYIEHKRRYATEGIDEMFDELESRNNRRTPKEETNYISLSRWRKKYDVPENTSYSLIQRGDIKAIKIGKIWKVEDKIPEKVG